ncbi:MAG TPA: gluconokinase [Agriterribacter sp.]|nr:gluconokinase [Agriterribacter sp.]
MSLFIGADIGTTNIKVIACNDKNEVLLSESSPCTTIQSSPEKVEQDPQIILESVSELLKRTITQLKGQPLGGICFSSAMHSIMAIDADNNPLTPAILWGDTRSMQQANELTTSGAAARLYRETGVPIHPALPLCKIIWMKEEIPEVFNRAYKFISLKEYLFAHWFGKYVIDHSIAGATGMQNIHTLQWSDTALRSAGISAAQLSQIVPVTHIEKQLVPKYRDYFSIDEDIPFVVGSSDGCLANVGTGVLTAGEATLTVGTSGAVRTTITQPSLNNEATLFCYPFMKDMFVKGGAVNNGGQVLQWFAASFMNRKLTLESDYALLVDQAFTVEAGAGGMIFLPYLQGERAPIWDANARGVFFGINNLHRQPHFIRAVLEGVSYALYHVFCELAKQGDTVQTVYASGGFVQSANWVQMVCDIFNKKVVVTDVADASAIGAAMLGFYSTGKEKQFNIIGSSFKGGTLFDPDKEKHSVYMRQFAIFCSLYEALKNEFPKLHPASTDIAHAR